MRRLQIIALLASTLCTHGIAQQKVPLTNQEKNETILVIQNILRDNYIFPAITDKINTLLDSNQKSGAYDSIEDPIVFANILTKDIQSFNHDRHLRVLFEPERIAGEENELSVEDSIRLEKKYISTLKKNNFYFKEVKILEGNIGYLDLRKFKDPKYAGKTAIAAMNFLSNSDAIIIDLRNNGGGTPKMVQLLASYFFDSEVVHLNSVYKRNENITKQFWTLPYVSGKRMPNVPLYILTSSNTFSAAEEFCYDLQSLKRAIIIGETTGGGAHPGGRIKATARYNVWTPTGRSINPITKTNWEEVGVKPHIKTSANKALLEAHIKALDSLKNESEDVDSKNYFDWHLKALLVKKNPVRIASSVLETYSGNYGIRSVSFEDDNLFYQRKNSAKYKLIPLDSTTFMVDGLSDFRIRFITINDKVVALLVLDEDGTSFEYQKDK